MNVYGSNLQFQQLQNPENLEAAREARTTVWEKMKGIFTGFKTQWNESQRIISGDYYTGQVEQYEYDPLGVFLEDVESSDEIFLEITANPSMLELEKEGESIDAISGFAKIISRAFPSGT